MGEQGLHFVAQLWISSARVVQKGLALNTVRAYRDAIKLLLCFVGDTVSRSVDALTVEDITNVTTTQ